MFKLHPYQSASVTALRAMFAEGKRRVVLVAPTGAGKTVIAREIVELAYRKGEHSVLFIADLNTLVAQTAGALGELPHKLVQAGARPNFEKGKIYVCSAQTLARRKIPAHAFCIVDECHVVHQGVMQQIKAQGCYCIGLTATPFTEVMGEFYGEQDFYQATTTNALTEAGYLSKMMHVRGQTIDVKGLKVKNGEWSGRELEERVRPILKNVVDTWEKTCEYVSQRQEGWGGKTVVFAPSAISAREIASAFAVRGYNFKPISYLEDAEESDQLIAEFRKPDSEIVGLVSCEKLSRGFDVPDIDVGIACRPYSKSIASHIQQIGRVRRTAKGKRFGIWIDHTGNTERFKERVDELEQHGISKLPSQSEAPKKSTPLKVLCPLCGAVLYKYDGGCLACHGTFDIFNDTSLASVLAAKNRSKKQEFIKKCPYTLSAATSAASILKPNSDEETRKKWAFAFCVKRMGIPFESLKDPLPTTNASFIQAVKDEMVMAARQFASRQRWSSAQRGIACPS